MKEQIIKIFEKYEVVASVDYEVISDKIEKLYKEKLREEQIKAILQKYLQLDMPNPEEAEMKVASEIEKLYQCEHILEKVKEANTPDKRTFEDAEAYKKMEKNKLTPEFWNITILKIRDAFESIIEKYLK